MTLNTFLLKIGKNHLQVQSGLLHCLRMCTGNKAQSSGQTKKQPDATYGAPEYYQYNEYSFNDMHAEIAKLRLPRPSSKQNKQEKK